VVLMAGCLLFATRIDAASAAGPPYYTPLGLRLTRDVQNFEREESLPVSDGGVFLNEEALEDVCGRRGWARAVSLDEVNEAYEVAGQAPIGGQALADACYHGCLLGNTVANQIARDYQAMRGGSQDSWRGKCISNGGTRVTNAIRVQLLPPFGPSFERYLFPGDVYQGVSMTDYNSTAWIIDYSGYNHDFRSYRDEGREVAPGVFVGKLYSLSLSDVVGASLGWNKRTPPSQRAPQGTFLAHFVLFRKGDQATGGSADPAMTSSDPLATAFAG